MIKVVVFLFLLCASISSYAEYKWSDPRAVDGDTVEFKVDWLPKELNNKIKIRVYGVDTPEKPPRALCQQEADKAVKASEFTKNLIGKSKNITVSVKGWDKYGGRLLGDVLIDGKSLREELINNKHAREYFGEAKQSWCN